MRPLMFLIIALLLLPTLTQGEEQEKSGAHNQNEIQTHTQEGEITQESAAPLNREENQKCLSCHGQRIYQYHNKELGQDIRKKMCIDYMIDTLLFSSSNHKSFKCTDCHSPDYVEFPHSGTLRMEMMYSCMDCHGGDEHYAKFHFEEIEEAFYQNLHYTRAPEIFSCWSCHNPHYYKTQSRTGENILQTITYDNNICLSCHANIDQYQLLTQRDEINILKTHSWLPNQELHFKNVRCIECHTQRSDTLLISHVVLPREDAIRECTQCHSENSYLMATLYRFQSHQARQTTGFLNAVILNESYVIGANRNKTLNYLSIILFGFIILGISLHILFRIFK